FRSCTWFSTYRIHHRRAAQFRDRRCFLLGDAAHIHSPVGAQGMNTGLQDAYNLAWKLALVTSGRADAALLDTYGSERVPVAIRLLATTDRLFSLVVSDGTLAGLFRTHMMPSLLAVAMSVEGIRKTAFRTISQIGIRYHQSSLSVTPDEWPKEAPRGGDRFPWLNVKLSSNGPVEDLFDKLDDTRFNLIVIGQEAPQSLPPGIAELVQVLVIPSDAANDRALERSKIPRPSFYLLRPDCYIGLCGTRLEADLVTNYLSERIGLTSASR